MVEDGKGEFGEPEKWEFDYPWEKVRAGFWMWAMSGFTKMPTQDEIDLYDKRWVDDMRLCMTIYRHQGNNSPEQRMVESFIAKEKFIEMTTAEYDDHGNVISTPTNKRRAKNAVTVMGTGAALNSDQKPR